jgi:L-fucose mutarotase/ribose pyranase (RbsD/FucU family)
MGPASRGLLAQLALKGVGGLYSKDAALADARTMLQFVSDMTESVNEDKKLSSSEQRMINQINKAIKEKRPIATLGFRTTQFYMQNKDMFTKDKKPSKKLVPFSGSVSKLSSSEQKIVNRINKAIKEKKPIGALGFMPTQFYMQNKDMFTESVNEDKKFSSSEQKMVNQIKRALKDKDPIYTLPTKTQDFYRKNKDMFAESMVNERLNVSRDLLTALYKDRGATAFAQMILELRDENALDDLVEALQNQYTI